MLECGVVIMMLSSYWALDHANLETVPCYGLGTELIV